MKFAAIDAHGHTYKIKRLTAGDQMRIRELGMSMQDDEAKAYALITYSVTERDGVPLAPLQNKAQLFFRADELDEAFAEIAAAFAELHGAEAAAAEVETAKN